MGDRHVKAVVAAHLASNFLTLAKKHLHNFGLETDLLVGPASPTVVSSEEGFTLAWNHKVWKKKFRFKFWFEIVFDFSFLDISSIYSNL